MSIYGSGKDEKDVRLIRIKNTLEIEKIYISEVMIPEAQKNPNLEIIGRPIRLRFSPEGRLMTGF